MLREHFRLILWLDDLNVYGRHRPQVPFPRSGVFWLQSAASALWARPAPAQHLPLPATATPFPLSAVLKSLNSYHITCLTGTEFSCLLDKVIMLLESLLFSSMKNKLRAIST